MADHRLLANALGGLPKAAGRRAKTKKTVRRIAEELGHRLGMFEARPRVNARSLRKNGVVYYHVAWCVTCNATAFTGLNHEVNPALDEPCKKGV